MTGGGEKITTVKEAATQLQVHSDRLLTLEESAKTLTSEFRALSAEMTHVKESLSTIVLFCRRMGIHTDPISETEPDPSGEDAVPPELTAMISQPGKFSRHPKIDFPIFDGNNPRGWIRKCVRYFQLNMVVDAHKVDLASIHLDGRADSWFLDYQEGKPMIEWSHQFSSDICCRFEDIASDNYVGSFNKLSQLTTVEEYFDRYESLKAIMKARNPSLSDDYFTMSFISGLKDEIRHPVQMFKPSTDTDAFYLARMQQASVDFQSNRSRPFSKAFPPSHTTYSSNTHSIRPVLSPLTTPPKPPFTNSKPLVTLPATPTKLEPSLPPINRLTPAQMKVRREKGLCYNCDEFYKHGHICKTQQLFMLVASEDNGSPYSVEELEDDTTSPSTSSLDSPMEISLHALTGLVTQNTIRVPGHLQSRDIFILIDTGSTHNFVDAKLAEQLQLPVSPTGHMLVTVANGDTTISKGIFPKLAWDMQGYDFVSDLRILPLGGCDMVLGVDWLKQLGDVMFSLVELRISFFYQGQHINHQGSSSLPTCNMISGNNFLQFLKDNTPAFIGQFFSISALPLEPIHPSIATIVESFSDVFSPPTSLPPQRELYHKIPLNPNSEHVSQRPYRCPHLQKIAVDQLVQELLDAGFIQESHIPFASPILLIKKKW
ncbi:uncharacterized protein LOC113295889 [Papaver somniferum]|uniref:uncharacterized protein LOC113295889 n=1 Tax=Papaver somniferum TaxID=3469 RepID=UPI000E6FDCD9|nr:uncharacterized protein LOC113295889 [Papaver somniferum]